MFDEAVLCELFAMACRDPVFLDWDRWIRFRFLPCFEVVSSGCIIRPNFGRRRLMVAILEMLLVSVCPYAETGSLIQLSNR